MRRVALVLALLAVLALPAGAATTPVGADPGTLAPDDQTGTRAESADRFPPAATAVPRSAVGGLADGFVAQQATPGEWTPSTTFLVQLHADGSARWRVVTTYHLPTASDATAFRAYGEEYEAGETAGTLPPAFFERLTDGASEVAGREMAIRNVTRAARVSGDTGTLVLGFTWTNFLGAGEGDQLVLRDAFGLPGGRTWLSSLEPGQRLVVRTPPGYTINYTSVPLVQQNDSAIIQGPREFSPEDPLTIRYRPAPGGLDPSEGLPWELLAGVGLAAAVVVAVVLRRRGLLGDTGPGPATEGGDGGLPGATEDVGAPGDAGGGAADETVAEGGSAGSGETTDDAEDADDADDAEDTEGVDLSLLSDEERVEHLLDDQGGRMRQARIVDETGWSDAKVSQLLSAMAEAGRVEKLRIGRENLISLVEDGESGESADNGPTRPEDDSDSPGPEDDSDSPGPEDDSDSPGPEDDGALGRSDEGGGTNKGPGDGGQ